MAFDFGSADDWHSRLRKIRDESALDRPLVIVVGSGLSLDRAEQQGVADVPMIVKWIRDGGVEFSAPPGQSECQAAMQALKTDQGARAVIKMVRRGVLQAYTGYSDYVTPAQGAPSEEQREACRQLEQNLDDWELPRGVIGLATYLRWIVDNRKKRPGGKTGAIQVVTTNYDPLVEIACKRFGVDVAAHSISHDAQPQALACEVQVWHVHGSWWDATLHGAEALSRYRDALKQALQPRMNDALICILGFGCWQDLVLTSIASTFGLLDGKGEVLWSFFEADGQQITDNYQEPLERLMSTRAFGQVRLFRGVDPHDWGESIVSELQVAVPAVPGSELSAVPGALMTRYKDAVRVLLDVTQAATKPSLTKLLAPDQRLPSLGAVLGEICYVIGTIIGRESRHTFARSGLDVVSALSACVLSIAPRAANPGAERESVTVESCLVAELLMAAEHRRALRLRLLEHGAEPADGLDLALLEEGPDGADWVLALEREFWAMKEPDVDYISARHKAALEGYLEAKKFIHEEVFATLNPNAPVNAIRQAIPHARFFLRGSSGAVSTGIHEPTLAELLKKLLECDPELCVDAIAKKAIGP